MILKFIAARSSLPAEPASGNRSLDCALFCYKALRKRLEHSRSGKKHSTTSRVSLYTSFCSSRFLRALQQERVQSRPLYYSNKNLLKSTCAILSVSSISRLTIAYVWSNGVGAVCTLVTSVVSFTFVNVYEIKYKKWAIKIMQKLPLISNYGVKECKPYLFSPFC